MASRYSWDTSVKHLERKGLLKGLISSEEYRSIPKSNLSRWKNEPEGKYRFCEINALIEQEIDLIKRLNSSSNIKAITHAYFFLIDTLHDIFQSDKRNKHHIDAHKALIVNSIDKVNPHIPIKNALRVFKISRGTYENYKNQIVYKCSNSFFNMCIKRHPHQLLKKEINSIKSLLNNLAISNWSRSSIYFKGLRDGQIKCSLATFYKYSKLLGYNKKRAFKKSDSYQPLKSNSPNEIWCADVTIFRTLDGIKHHIHILMDHYSKFILGCEIHTSSSGFIIRQLLSNARSMYLPKRLTLVTDGGSENVNQTLKSFLSSICTPSVHLVAQKDIRSSNSSIEALNKILKHQFLYPSHPRNKNELWRLIQHFITTYNNTRPQHGLKGSTPIEIFTHQPFELNALKAQIIQQRLERNTINMKNPCHNICT